ncbi:MAG: hypothetical protein JWR80_3888 [Bradyrhizobium sp.]|nr:hypothetical protein [Bradyrhizobium sp.]
MVSPIEFGPLGGITRGPLRQWRASLQSLLRAVGLLARVLLPLAVICLLDLAALHLLYLRNPARTDGMRVLNIDHYMVLEQIQRAATTPAAEVAFIGDSSCLMGIDPVSMERSLALGPIQSFCSIGYIGPAGYAHMLTGMIERNLTPKVLILVFHPATFRREPGWESWVPFVKNAGIVRKSALPFPRSALDYLEFEWIGRLIYNPLPGVYGRYYGGEGQFRSTIRTRQGSAIDPGVGLNVSSLEALRVAPTPPAGILTDYSWNEAYVEALKVLGETIKILPPQTRVYLVISPVPDVAFPAEAAVQRAERTRQIAAVLGISDDHVLPTPGAMFTAYFSSHTHLNRWGQVVFTGILSKELAAKMAVTGKSP